VNGEGTLPAGEAAAPAEDALQRAARAPDEAWVADLRAPDGTPCAAAALERLRTLVAGAVRKATAGSAPDAGTLDDLIQVATLRVLRNLERFEGRSKFATWAWAVAVRAAFGELRRAAYRARGEGLAESGAEELATPAAPPERRAMRQEIVEILERLIAEELTERQRTAILGELAGTPQEELLATLGGNRNALYKLLHDARQKLKLGLLGAGVCDDQVREAFDL